MHQVRRAKGVPTRLPVLVERHGAAECYATWRIEGVACIMKDIQMSQPSKKKRQIEPNVDQLQSRLEMLAFRIHAAKIAYLNRTPLDGKAVSYEDLTAVARQYIQASHALQKVKFGSVKVKMSVAKLLR